MTRQHSSPPTLGCFSLFLLTGLGLLLANIFLTPTYIAEGLAAIGVLLLLLHKTHQWMHRNRNFRRRRSRAR